MNELNLTIFSDTYDKVPTTARVSWCELVAILREWNDKPEARADKLAHPAMVLGGFDGKRSNDNVTALDAICADIDTKPSEPGYRTFDGWRETLAAIGVAHIIYTTTTSRASHHKVRIVMPFAEPIGTDRYKAAWQAVNAKLGGVMDAGTHDATRLSFLPARWHGGYRDKRTGKWIEVHDGYDAFASGDGEPILSAAEIAALPLIPINTTRTNSTSRTAAPAIRIASPAPVANHLRAALIDLDRSPLVTPAIRHNSAIRTAKGKAGRQYTFMLAVASRALRNRYPIDATVLAELGRAYARTDLDREPDDDLDRQAENALALARSTSAPGGSRQLNL